MSGKIKVTCPYCNTRCGVDYYYRTHMKTQKHMFHFNLHKKYNISTDPYDFDSHHMKCLIYTDLKASRYQISYYHDRQMAKKILERISRNQSKLKSFRGVVELYDSYPNERSSNQIVRLSQCLLGIKIKYLTVNDLLFINDALDKYCLFNYDEHFTRALYMRSYLICNRTKLKLLELLPDDYKSSIKNPFMDWYRKMKLITKIYSKFEIEMGLDKKYPKSVPKYLVTMEQYDAWIERKREYRRSYRNYKEIQECIGEYTHDELHRKYRRIAKEFHMI